MLNALVIHIEPLQSEMVSLCDCNICITAIGKPVMLSNLMLCSVVLMMIAALAFTDEIGQCLYMHFFDVCYRPVFLLSISLLVLQVTHKRLPCCRNSFRLLSFTQHITRQSSVF